MKVFMASLMIVFSACFASCEDKQKTKLRFLVVDDAGKPVGGAKIRVSTFSRWKPSEGFGKDINEVSEGITDNKGFYEWSSAIARNQCAFAVTKLGHYETAGGRYSFDHVSNGRWEPWNPSIQIELKRVLKPIPLISKNVIDGFSSPVRLPATKAAFDLEVGDWVTPHGAGRVSDVIFQIEGGVEELSVHYDAKLSVTFANEKDGLILFESDPSNSLSALRAPYQAPLVGYLNAKVWRKARLAGPTTGVDKGIDQILDDSKSTENYFLRVRTVIDSKGEIISAHYAKVYGGFCWGPEKGIKFQYYFNPAANDRNLEFDATKNLLKVKKQQEVTDP